MPADEIDLVSGSPRVLLRESFVTGLAVVVPVLVTVVVLAFVLNQLYQYLNLFSDVVVALPFALGSLFIPAEVVVELVTPLLLVVSILVVGLVVNSSRYGERAVDYFDYLMTSVPGIGSVYESFRQMSDVMLDSDTQNFREVKLVEFPHEGAYTLGFVTTETPEPVAAPTGHDRLLTLFLPLAPNPVMGGHLVHVPADRVMDVDMTVEEGVRAVVTSGVAVGGATETSPGLSPDQLRSLATVARADQRLDPDESPDVHRSTDGRRADRRTRYDDRVDPAHAETPDDLARREREAERVADGPDHRPAEAAGRTDAASEDTEVRPAAVRGRDAAPAARDGEGGGGDAADAVEGTGSAGGDPADPDDDPEGLP
jgi:uncharacterized membrane protein